MILVDDVIISDLVVETRFACPLAACRGAGCQEGDRGSPLLRSELTALKHLVPLVAPLLRPDIAAEVQEGRFFVRDGTHIELRCLPDGRCIFARVLEVGGPLTCMVERLWHEGRSSFRKPRFCHLFPLRVEDYYGRRCLNIEQRDDCRHGFAPSAPLVVETLADALVTEFGATWHGRLVEAVKTERRRRGLD